MLLIARRTILNIVSILSFSWSPKTFCSLFPLSFAPNRILQPSYSKRKSFHQPRTGCVHEYGRLLLAAIQAVTSTALLCRRIGGSISAVLRACLCTLIFLQVIMSANLLLRTIGDLGCDIDARVTRNAHEYNDPPINSTATFNLNIQSLGID